MLSEAEEGVDFFCDGAMFTGGTIYIMQQDGLGEWSGLKLVFPYKVSIDEHSSCSGVQEGGGSNRGEGVWGGLWKDVGLSRRGCRWSHRVICVRAFTIHWCDFSLASLRHRRGGWITTVFTVQSNYRRQLGCTFHQLRL